MVFITEILSASKIIGAPDAAVNLLYGFKRSEQFPGLAHGVKLVRFNRGASALANKYRKSQIATFLTILEGF